MSVRASRAPRFLVRKAVSLNTISPELHCERVTGGLSNEGDRKARQRIDDPTVPVIIVLFRVVQSDWPALSKAPCTIYGKLEVNSLPRARCKPSPSNGIGRRGAKSGLDLFPCPPQRCRQWRRSVFFLQLCRDGICRAITRIVLDNLDRREWTVDRHRLSEHRRGCHEQRHRCWWYRRFLVRKDAHAGKELPKWCQRFLAVPVKFTFQQAEEPPARVLEH